MSIMRSRPNIKYCTLLSVGSVKDRCLRMADFAQNRQIPTSTIEHLQSTKCSLHQDADTCWDLLAIETTKNTKINSETFETIKEICSQISLSIGKRNVERTKRVSLLKRVKSNWVFPCATKGNLVKKRFCTTLLCSL